MTYGYLGVLQVYNEVTSLVTSCIDGYNVCMFAYGQTGSGKTYTMEVRTVHVPVQSVECCHNRTRVIRVCG